MSQGAIYPITEPHINQAKREQWAPAGAVALHHDCRLKLYRYTTEANHRLSAALQADSISVNNQATGTTISTCARECVCGVMFIRRPEGRAGHIPRLFPLSKPGTHPFD